MKSCFLPGITCFAHLSRMVSRLGRQGLTSCFWAARGTDRRYRGRRPPRLEDSDRLGSRPGDRGPRLGTGSPACQCCAKRGATGAADITCFPRMGQHSPHMVQHSPGGRRRLTHALVRRAHAHTHRHTHMSAARTCAPRAHTHTGTQMYAARTHTPAHACSPHALVRLAHAHTPAHALVRRAHGHTRAHALVRRAHAHTPAHAHVRLAPAVTRCALCWR